MNETLSLNRYNLAGSRDWQIVLRHFELGEGFAFIVLLVDDEQGVETCRKALTRFLENRGEKLLELPAYPPDSLKHIWRPLLRSEMKQDTGAVWVSRAVPESYSEYPIWREAWRQGVTRLNQFRNQLRRQWSVPVIFVGAPWLQEVLRDDAPDLWSVRTLVARVEPKKTADLATVRYFTAPDRLGYNPDPELAIGQANWLRSEGGSETGIARLLYRAGLGFAGQYRWEEAKSAFLQVLEIRRRIRAGAEDEADAAFQLARALLWGLDYKSSQSLFGTALELYRESGSSLGEANCLQSLGDISLARSEYARAQQFFDEALGLYRRLGDPLGEANCLQKLGDIGFELSDHDTARQFYEKALPLHRRASDILGQANCLQGLGDIAIAKGDYSEAEQRYTDALQLYRRLENPQGEGNCLFRFGDVARGRLDYEEARMHYAEAARKYEETGDQVGEANCVRRLGDLDQDRSDYVQAQRHYETALELYDQIGNPYAIGSTHVRLAEISGSEQDRADHLQLAREAFLKIGRADLVQQLEAEFGAAASSPVPQTPK